MKKSFLIFLFCVMFSVVAFCQSKEVYALIRIVDAAEGIMATFDIGDGTERMEFATEKGKTRKFVSDFEPINILLVNGWEIVKFSCPTLTYTKTSTIWVMKKKVNDDSEIKKGLILKKW